MSNRSSTYVGIVVTILIIAAVGTIGYYQEEVAPGLVSTTTSNTTSTSTAAACTPSTCVNITIVAGASSPPSCYPNCAANNLYGYSPSVVILVMGVNNTVIWTNDDNPAVHTASSSAGDPKSWDSGCLGSSCPTPLASFTYTFTAVGTYYYHCDYHTWMEGEIIVKPGSSGTPVGTTTQTS